MLLPIKEKAWFGGMMNPGDRCHLLLLYAIPRLLVSCSEQGRVRYLAFNPGMHGIYVYNRNYQSFMTKIFLVTVEGMRGFPCFFHPIQLPGNANEIRGLSFSPDGEFLICVDENGQLLVWKLHDESYELNPSLYWRSSDSFFTSDVSLQQAKISNLNRRLLEARIENYEAPSRIIGQGFSSEEDDQKVEMRIESSLTSLEV